jgi:hypothetical protein
MHTDYPNALSIAFSGMIEKSAARFSQEQRVQPWHMPGSAWAGKLSLAFKKCQQMILPGICVNG